MKCISLRWTLATSTNTSTNGNDGQPSRPAPSFLPGRQPPGNSSIYHVHVQIKFKQWDLLEGRSEPGVELLLQQTIIEASDPDKRLDFMPIEEYYYRPRDYCARIMEPKSHVPGQDVGLTWGIWTDALVGFSRFRWAWVSGVGLARSRFERR